MGNEKDQQNSGSYNARASKIPKKNKTRDQEKLQRTYANFLKCLRRRLSAPSPRVENPIKQKPRIMICADDDFRMQSC